MDYNIALPQFNVAPAQVGGPVNMLTDVMKLKSLQQDQQLNQMKMQEYQRARGDAATKRAEDAKTKAELARIYGAGVNNLSPAAPANSLVAPAEAPTPQMGFGANVGEYAPAPAPAAAPAAATVAPTPGAPNYAGIITELVKGGHIEEAKKMADLAKSHTETRGKEYENNVKQIDAAYAPLQALTNRVQNPADVAAYTQMLYNDPVLGPQAAKIKPLEQAIADSQREFAANPQQWQLAHSKVDGKVIYDAATTSVAPKIVAKDVGGSIKYIDENPKSPTFMKEVGDFAKTLSPKDIAEEADTSKKVVRTITDDRGNVTGLNDKGEIVVTHKGMGAPSAARQKANMQAETMPKQLDYAISELKNAIKPGGALEAATSSGAGALADTAAGFVGYATPGAIASAQLKPVQDIILKMVPRFEGPQSDRDVISYRQASGELANEKLPVKIRQAAAETIIRLMEARKGQFITSEMATGDVPVQTSAGDDISAADAILAKGKK
jgi:hypothetical protein